MADCFKYRNKIGIDVAIEALRDCRKQRKATFDELWQAAKVCRMTNIMRPYLEATASLRQRMMNLSRERGEDSCAYCRIRTNHNSKDHHEE